MLAAPPTATKVWVPNQKGTDRDIEATYALLELRSSPFYKKAFVDKKHSKMSLWQKIAEALCEMGFDVGSGKEGAEKCRQKFANLQKKYTNYVDNINKTGSAFSQKPMFYDEMHSILGDKDRTAPKHLIDSFQIQVSDELTDLYGAGPSTSLDTSSSHSAQPSPTISRQSTPIPTTAPESSTTDTTKKTDTFKATKTSAKVKTPKNEIIETIIKLNKEQMEFQKKTAEAIQDSFNKFIDSQAEYKGKLLTVLERLCKGEEKKQSKKRKRSPDTNSSS